MNAGGEALALLVVGFEGAARVLLLEAGVEYAAPVECGADVVVVVWSFEDREEVERELDTVVDEETVVLDEDPLHPPVIDGTALAPFPMGTRFCPQLAPFARWIFLLSWS